VSSQVTSPTALAGRLTTWVTGLIRATS
jgi:hypothetical protein